MNQPIPDRRSILATFLTAPLIPACANHTEETVTLPSVSTPDLKSRAIVWEETVRRAVTLNPTPNEPAVWDSFWKTVRTGFSTDKTNLNPGSHGSPSLMVTRSLVESAESHWADSKAFADAAEHTVQEVILPALSRCLGLDDTSNAYLTKNTTAGTEAVVVGFPFKKGDEFIIASTEHSTASEYLKFRELNSGIVRKTIDLPIGESTTVEDIVKAYTSQVTPNTKFVLLSHTTYIEGLKLPMQEICTAIKSINPDVHIHVDGAHSLGMGPINILQLGCDSFAASGHKWLSGPESSGALWISPEAKKLNTHPLITRGNGTYTAATGAPNLLTMVAFGKALELQELLGPERVWQRIQEGRNLIVSLLKNNPKLRQISAQRDARLHSGMVTYELVDPTGKEVSPNEATVLATKCRELGVEIKNATDFGKPFIRIGAPISVSPEEITSGIEILKKVI